ncbi:insulinase family protein [Coraliomargarita sinensis]|uniref:Insulinase family protein n=1 Tax=Coraliomargarita sinensis TaxID=2174842 RepID=A0A317ZLM9_9BACT|nr:pitrilysin family protein [Coraliomargarita sinensis]PXA05133.1 insulinase family protein [Coraliomargarita sinensis]
MSSKEQQTSTFESHDLIDRLFRAPVERHVLENGLTLVHRPDYSSEVVSVQVWVKTGSIHEDTLIGSGLSHYLEHLLFKGTARREGKAISREVHAMGASMNAYTTFDRTVYYIDGPSSAFPEMADVLSDLVLHSTLPEAEVLRERDVILREIDMGLDDPDRQLTQALFRTAFCRHPYREPVIGHRELFERVTVEELRRYYKERYVPNNIVVSIVGAVRPSECAEVIDKTFGVVPRGRLAPVQVDTEPVQLAPRREDILGDYNVFRGGVCFKVPHLSHPDSPKLDALAHALGGGESSLLWERLRNQRKLVHYVDCRNWNPGENGLFMISYVCDPERGAEVEASIHELIEEVITTGFESDVVEKACRQALSSEINGRKTMSGQATRLGIGEVVIGDINYGRRYLNRLRSIGNEDLQEVAKHYLVDSNCSAVTLGPALDAPGEFNGEDEGLTLEPFEEVAFESGARLLLQQDSRLPKVHIRTVMLGGPLYEPEGQRGVSSLMAELLTKDTAKRGAVEISELIESIGGTFRATCGNNTISLALEVLPNDLGLALGLLKDALTQPSFNHATFETERQAQIANLKEEQDEILEFGFQRLREHFFGEHPFAVGPDGRVEDLKELTREDVEAHFRELVRAGNIILVVAGDFDRDQLMTELTPLLAEDLCREPFAPKLSPFPGLRESLDLTEAMEREQAVILQAYPGSGIQDDDFVTNEVLNELFSGMSSRLFEQVREDRGMAYYVGSTCVIGLDGGMFVFFAGTHPSRVEEVLVEIEKEIDRVVRGEVTDEELRRCRIRLKAARPMSRQTIGARAMHAALQLCYGLPLNDDAEHAVKLDATDATTLADFAKRHFAPDNKVRLVVGPKKA